MASFLSYLSPVRDLLYKEQNYDAAYAQIADIVNQRELAPQEQRAVYELAATILREQKRYEEAIDFYITVSDVYQAGYCEMLRGNILGARTYWQQVLRDRQNHWCLCLGGMVVRELMAYPTTFQIRNQLESDVCNLVEAGQTEFLDNLLCYADFLVQINPEAYKFLGRSLMHAGLLDKADGFLFKGQKVLPNDPEIYYHLGQYTCLRKEYDDARVLLNQCLLISPTYNPARNLLSRIENETF